jgi:hypothetical protein
MVKQAGHVVAWIVLVAFLAEPAAASAIGMKSTAYHVFLEGKARSLLRLALDGAIRRLARPTCQQLFTDFADSTGHPLADTLAAWGMQPGEALAALNFVDGDSLTQCREDGGRAAFTAPYNQVIYVCGKRFADQFAMNVWGGEILLIHELLHALGLGENPPTSAHITHQVRIHCGQ